MAAKIYSKGLAALLESARHLEEAGMKVVLVDNNYTFNVAHDFYDDVSSFLVAGTSAIALTSPAVTESAGVVTFDAADTGLTWNSVSDADSVKAAIVFNDTGTPGTSPLVAYLDRASGLLATNGSNIVLTFHASGIFALNVA